MTPMFSVAKSPQLFAISSRAFGKLSKCPNSKCGLGMSDLQEVKNSLAKA